MLDPLLVYPSLLIQVTEGGHSLALLQLGDTLGGLVETLDLDPHGPFLVVAAVAIGHRHIGDHLAVGQRIRPGVLTTIQT